MTITNTQEEIKKIIKRIEKKIVGEPAYCHIKEVQKSFKRSEEIMNVLLLANGCILKGVIFGAILVVWKGYKNSESRCQVKEKFRKLAW